MAHPKIEGERLHIDLQKLRDKGEATPLDAVEAFEALLNGPRRTSGYSSNEAQLLEYAMPVIKDWKKTFHEDNVISGFQDLRQMVSQWGEMSQEAKDLIMSVIKDELARFSELRERRQAGIAA